MGYGLEYYGPSQTLIGVNIQAKQCDYSVVLELVRDPENFDVEEIFERLIANHVEGIVCCIPSIGSNMDAISDYARQIQQPFIFTDYQSVPDLSVIEMDNFLGGQLATEHLLAQGHRAVAIITGLPSYFSAQERVRGWRAAMLRHGLEPDEHLMAEGDWTAASGARAIEQILAQRPDVTALFAGNDQMALGSIYYASNHGLRIPDDLAIVGYDDIPEAAFFSPSLTSVRQNLISLGAQAVMDVIKQVEHKSSSGSEAPLHRLIPPELTIRQSSMRRR